jgi:acyl-CoA dehydrogenase
MTEPLERARAIASGVAARHAGAVDIEGRFPTEAFAALKDARLLAPFVPKALGGEGLSVSEIASICHLLGRSCGSTGLIYAMHQIQTACIVLHGQDIAWQRDWLRRLAVEQLLLASATTEAATGGDLGRSDCAILRDGDRFTVEKHGAVISYGEHADGILVTARRAPDAPASDQVLAVIPRQQFALETTAQWDAMGMRGTCSNTYVFRGEGGVDQILPRPYGDIQSNTMAPFSHLTWASVWLGIAVDAVSRARRYLRGKAGANTSYNPALTRLVEATAMLQQMKASIVSALRSYEAVLASSDRTVTLGLLVTVNTIKISVAMDVVRVVQQAMMICGIAGYRNDSDFSVARHLRDAHSAALMVGNDRITAGMGKMLLMQRADADLLAPGDSR